jgi:hypothetical protein
MGEQRMPHKRRPLAAPALHDLLVREFDRTAAGLCSACSVPKPIFVEAKDGRPNWRVPPLGECDALCHTILLDLAEKLGREYELAR